MQWMKGSINFNILLIETDTSSLQRIKIYPFEIYYERNTDPDDTRIQIGIGIFSYRIGVVLDKSNTG